MANDLFGNLGNLGGIVKGLSSFMPQDDPAVKMINAQTQVSDLKKQEADIYVEILTCECTVSKEGLYAHLMITVSKKEVVTNSCNNSKSYGNESGDKIHGLLVALTKLAELGEYNSKKLNNNRRVNVGLNTECKERHCSE